MKLPRKLKKKLKSEILNNGIMDKSFRSKDIRITAYNHTNEQVRYSLVNRITGK